ncbi:GNAT family N-acetyltransferase [Croceicoccus mobilis]|uniref:N-acetyltransferase domain-containing protein n=1 Tax=Croceicoccus mobilis TaxID=1703339 RepID=A0A917DPZ6_9SPHN|nr:GNAT family N-acetyltransferase [Croceicoccus mobilis]GGD55626.1 hypothetical protein GCM10010990_00920 [Croceicoccus mobilis]
MPQRAVVEAIMRIMNTAFDPAYGEAWNQPQVVAALVLPETRAVLIGEDGAIDPEDLSQVQGFALLRRIIDEEELLLFAVSPEARGKGLGGKLIDHCVASSRAAGCARIFLEMRDDNPARWLYLGHGFKPIGLRRDYYTGADGQRRNAITFMQILA